MAVSLADFDPQVVAEYGIAEEYLSRVMRYLRLLQRPDVPALADIAVGGHYGTAALLHEVVEVRLSLRTVPALLSWNKDKVRRFFYTHRHFHIRALVVEHLYLQQKMWDEFDIYVRTGTLVRAHAGVDEFDALAVSNVAMPIFRAYFQTDGERVGAGRQIDQ